MEPLNLHDFHQRLGGCFMTVSGMEMVADYGDFPAEHAALGSSAGVLDLSSRSRLCLAGADRKRFLHGQVTNDVNRLEVGEGCYAALTNAKGKMQSDANIYCLPDELLLDFEPGLVEEVRQRLDKHLVADDAQIVDVAALYGLVSVQGPKAGSVIRDAGLVTDPPAKLLSFVQKKEPALGEVYLMNQPRLATAGFDLFVPISALGEVAANLVAVARTVGGGPCGWRAFETARIEAGIPRFGVDMDESNFPQECGIESRAISYSKGCYLGQETLNRIHTLGHVNRELRGLRLADNLVSLPVKGDQLYQMSKEVGHLTSAVASPKFHANIALGYVRREASALGTELTVRTAQGEISVRVVELPFR